MDPTHIVPRYRLMMSYDIRPEMYESYYQYVLGEFIPALQNMGLHMLAAWHVAYGNYPIRQVEFVSDNLQTVQSIFTSSQWESLEDRLKTYTLHYERKLVRYRDGFQF